MKIISTILMIMMLFLVGQQVCSASSFQVTETESCCSSGSQDCEDEQGGDSGKEHKDDCKGCNPFQNCSCCAVGVLNAPLSILISQNGPVYFTKTKLYVASQDLLSVDLSGFWQPPRRA